MKKINVVELFAGVGGFSLGLERASKNFNTIFSNQWEPSTKNQFAFRALEKNFVNHKKMILSNEDIAVAKEKIPNNVDLLVGGFPCQDYSVASTNAKGIEGKKGVLWWEISWILKNKSPKYILLENVDRLLKSPVKTRGRDFAIMLKNFDKLNYDVEWRMINAAEYSFNQRRKRIFIFANRRDVKQMDSIFDSFKINPSVNKTLDLNKYIDELDITNNYNDGKFLNSGKMTSGQVNMFNFDEIFENNKSALKNILDNEWNIKNPNLLLNEKQIEKLKVLKGPKKIKRVMPSGEEYIWSEGKMNFFDDINKPSRTMLTSESSINRATHVIKHNNDFRFLSPVECERLNGFPDNWTNDVMTDKQRYFCMGNALVVGVIELIGKQFIKNFEKDIK